MATSEAFGGGKDFLNSYYPCGLSAGPTSESPTMYSVRRREYTRSLRETVLWWNVPELVGGLSARVVEGSRASGQVTLA
jgi:hypothetical protein